MHLEEIEMYKTKDGSMFDSSFDATAHVVDQICEDINEQVKENVVFESISYFDLMKIIEQLAGTIDRAEALKKILDKNL